MRITMAGDNCRMVSSGKHQRFFSLIVNLLLAFSLLLLGINLLKILAVGGWTDRSSFFLDGDLAPTLPDFVFNEIVLPFFLLYILIFGIRPIIFAIFIISAFVYFTRAPLILLFCALIFSPNLLVKQKALALGVLFFISIGVLYLRLSDGIFDVDSIKLFFFSYPFVGFARLIETSANSEVNAFHIISILLKPIDAVFFAIDYLFGLGGSLSAARFVGSELNQFVYLPLLGNSFNAFGTIAYPFILIFGWFFGLFFFFSFILITYFCYRVHFQKHAVAFRIIMMFLFSGLLFSWGSPFVWVWPFLFPRSLVQNRSPMELIDKL